MGVVSEKRRDGLRQADTKNGIVHASQRFSRGSADGCRVRQEFGGRMAFERGYAPAFQSGLLDPGRHAAYRAVNVKNAVRLGSGALSSLTNGIVVETIKLAPDHQLILQHSSKKSTALVSSACQGPLAAFRPG